MYTDFEITYSEDVFESERQAPEHFHSGFELDFFTSADVKMFTKNTAYSIGDGDLMLLEERCLHRMIYSAGKKYSRYVINMERSFIEPLLRFYGLETELDRIFSGSSRKIAVPMRRRARIGEQFEQMYRIAGRPAAPVERARLQSMVFLLLCSIGRMPRDAVQEQCSAGEQLVQSAIACIEQNFTGHLELDGIADTLHCSKYHICHVFKRMTGFSVTEYIQYCRITCAQELLLSPERRSMTEICYACGFSSIQHFYRVFHKLCGMTPLEYRRSSGPALPPRIAAEKDPGTE